MLFGALALTTACNNEEFANGQLMQNGEYILTASVESNTRTYVEYDETGKKYNMLWNSSDAIIVYNNSTSKTLTYKSGEGDISATFSATFAGTAPAFTDAVYPAGDNGFTMKNNAPDTYNFRKSYTMDDFKDNRLVSNSPMHGTVSGTTVKFSHLAGMIRITLKDVPAGSTNNILTLTSEQAITGEATYDASGDTPTLTAPTATDDNKTVTVTFDNETDADSEFVFDIPIPAGSYSNGIGTVELNIEGKPTELFTITNESVHAGSLFVMPTIQDVDYIGNIQGLLKEFTVKATIVDDSYSYDGLEMQIGIWDEEIPSTQETLSTATVADCKASFFIDPERLNSGSKFWVCIPKVVKFFHTLTEDEWTTGIITLPDKEGGSTLKDNPNANGTPYENDWIVALYMGANKDASREEDAIPIYWATGNLIATMINDNNDVAFHIATIAETEAETVAGNYGRELTQWDKYYWGDPTGAATDGSVDYAPEITTGMSFSGNPEHDVASAQLGGSWRLPTGRSHASEDNEFGGFVYNSMLVNGITVTYNNGCVYTYLVETGGISNTLTFPASGSISSNTTNFNTNSYWSGLRFSSGIQKQVFYFNGSRRLSHYSVPNVLCAIRPVTE